MTDAIPCPHCHGSRESNLGESLPDGSPDVCQWCAGRGVVASLPPDGEPQNPYREYGARWAISAWDEGWAAGFAAARKETDDGGA